MNLELVRRYTTRAADRGLRAARAGQDARASACEVNGAHRWLGFGPLQFQPSEIMKLALVLHIAAVIARAAEDRAHRPDAGRPGDRRRAARRCC